ncbi:hypothetical protein [Wenzhouxiangella sp. XN79A]|uniref:hypothetical protein n=1 Tax=Wenzhouxiangella sp. XN79A TaxID=2724193 RepID=UPI00197DAACA|nr:hypothetical protein [Wenzhouxiangella sp. XN79A]
MVRFAILASASVLLSAACSTSGAQEIPTYRHLLTRCDVVLVAQAKKLEPVFLDLQAQDSASLVASGEGAPHTRVTFSNAEILFSSVHIDPIEAFYEGAVFPDGTRASASHSPSLREGGRYLLGLSFVEQYGVFAACSLPHFFLSGSVFEIIDRDGAEVLIPYVIRSRVDLTIGTRRSFAVDQPIVTDSDANAVMLDDVLTSLRVAVATGGQSHD